jgi:hypothetical protein
MPRCAASQNRSLQLAEKSRFDRSTQISADHGRWRLAWPACGFAGPPGAAFAPAFAPALPKPGGWRGKERSIIWLHGSFEMTARLDADELTRAIDRDPKLANAKGWASEQARYPGLVKCRVSACSAVLPWAFTRHAARAFDAGAKKLEFDIDVCLWATGKAPPSSPYEWLIVSWVDDDRAFRMRAGRPMMMSPRAEARLPPGPQKPLTAFCRRPAPFP